MAMNDKLEYQNRNQVREKVDIYKKKLWGFIASDLLNYLVLIVLFFLTSIGMSNLLTSERALSEYGVSKINEMVFHELIFFIVATIFVVGCLVIIQKLLDEAQEWFVDRIDGILQEISKFIYVIGASMTGAFFASYVFVIQNKANDGKLLLLYNNMALKMIILSLGLFIIGCFLSVAFHKKTHILNANVANRPVAIEE